jgi:O-antigen/teichoic acid export membrane protein
MTGAPNLADRAISAAKWNYFGNGTRALSQFLIGLVLARMLGPEAFGLVAIGWLVIGIGKLFADLGFGAALIQSPDLTQRDVGFVWTAQVAVGGLLSVIGIAGSPYIAGFFNQPSAAGILQAMSCLFLIQSFGQAGTALLNRSLKFKLTQIASVVSYLIGYLFVGIPCAYAGMGAWSLVVAQLIQSTLYATTVAAFSGIKLRPYPSPDSPAFYKFGSKVIGANLSSWGILNLDSFIIARLFSATDLGLYNRAMALVGTPVGVITTSLQAVLFAACSRSGSNPVHIKKAYLGVTGLLALLTLPIFVTAAVVPKTIISALYGHQWMAAVSLLSPLALAMPLHALLAVVGPILTAIDKVEMELKSQLLTLFIMAPVLYIASHHSLVAVAWSMLLIYFLRWLFLMLAISNALRLRFSEIGLSLIAPLACSLMVAIPTWYVDHLLEGVAAFWGLAAVMIVASASFLFSVRLLGPFLLSGALREALVASGRLPRVASRWLRVS